MICLANLNSIGFIPQAVSYILRNVTLFYFYSNFKWLNIEHNWFIVATISRFIYSKTILAWMSVIFLWILILLFRTLLCVVFWRQWSNYRLFMTLNTSLVLVILYLFVFILCWTCILLVKELILVNIENWKQKSFSEAERN